MIYISAFKFPLLFLYKETVVFSRSLRNHPRIYRNIHGGKFFTNMKSGLDDTEKISKWTYPLLRSRKKSNDIIIENLNKTGINLLNVIPVPSTKDESWKFASLDKLFNMSFSKNIVTDEQIPKLHIDVNRNDVWMVFVNGVFSRLLSSVENLPKDVYLGPFSDLCDIQKRNISDVINKGESSINGGFFSALNAACLEDIIVLLIPENYKLEQHVHVVFSGCGLDGEFYLNQKFVVIGSKNSTSKVIQYHIGNQNSKYFDNTTTNIVLHENSRLKYIFINQIPDSASQIVSIHAELLKSSTLEISSAFLGGFVSRINLGIDMNGMYAHVKARGISLVNNNRIADLHSRISHNYPECSSFQLHKNLISDRGHAVFAGKIQAHSGSFNVVSEQLCKTLLLSPTCRVDAMPILEINNENVKCTHGSTVSDLDKNQIFYFQSRGIDIDIARKLLTNGFAREILRDFPENFENFFSISTNSL
nr:Fe-S cluster assembly protein SufD [Cryptomonas sp.]